MQIGNSQHHRVPAAQAVRPEQITSRGKSAESVGFLAKADVAASGDAEPNSIGSAASRIARMDVTLIALSNDPPSVPETGEIAEPVFSPTVND